MSGEGTIEQVLAGQAAWTVVHGDCRELLALLPDCSVDSVVTDAPYELGFMGKGWDRSGVAFDPAIWAEVLRVLKPGGHLLAFGGTRTYHRMTCAIEDAGFEIRDSIHWLYGSGFPKSLNVSKAIDAQSGAEPTVIGSRVLQGRAAQSCSEKGGTYSAAAPSSAGLSKTIDVTTPTTPKAQQWDGWGTALKPGHEPIVLARKPLTGTVAANVLTHGTGALNIDGCRVATDWNEPDRPESWKASGHTADPGAEKIAAPPGAGIECHPGGRWPANVVFTHSAGCRRVGERRVRSQCAPESAPGRAQNAVYGHFTRFDDNARNRHGGTDGTESVPTYDCADDCPVRALDGQSGESKGSGAPTVGGPPRANRGELSGRYDSPASRDRSAAIMQYGNTGTAARFFNCFEWDPEVDDPAVWPPFLYCAKASTAEREAGCEKLPKHSAGALTDRSYGTDGLKSPRAGAGRTSSGRANVHPTVKPWELLRFLCRLVTPPGGVVLDIYSGSGTTGIACVVEGFRFVGCDLIDTHVAIARARIAHWMPKQLDLFARTGT